MKTADILRGGWFTDVLQAAEEVKMDSDGHEPQRRGLAEGEREHDHGIKPPKIMTLSKRQGTDTP